MLKQFRVSIASLFMLVLIPGPSLAQQPQNDYRDLAKVVLDELKETNTPGAAVAIVSGDRVIYAKGFGVANMDTGAVVTPNMLFRVGSITKMLTATVLVSLSEEEKIALDAPIGVYVKGFSPRLSRVTAHQLMSHSAGIIDYARSCCAQNEEALETQVHALTDDDYFFTEPGRIFSYSNPSFIIAGYIIQELTGKPYADAMNERLFQPLGMTHTTFRPTVAMTFPLSQGHDATGTAKPTVVRPFVNNVGDWPAGFAYTNVFDLARFTIAFMNGGRINGKQVLSPSLIATLSKPYADVPFSWNVPAGFLEGAKYGHGFFIQEHRGLSILHHGGTIPGFGAFLVMVPAHKFAVIVLANKTASILGKTTEKAMELMLPLKTKPAARRQPTMPMTLAEMESYAGTYVNGAFKIKLFVKDGKLFRQDFYPTTVEEGPGREYEAPVTKVGANRFAFTPPGDSVPTEFVLVPGPGGKVEYLHSALETASKVEAQP